MIAHGKLRRGERGKGEGGWGGGAVTAFRSSSVKNIVAPRASASSEDGNEAGVTSDSSANQHAVNMATHDNDGRQGQEYE